MCWQLPIQLRQRLLDRLPGRVQTRLFGFKQFLYHILLMGKVHLQAEQWLGGMAKNITFIVTKDCQLACKYCYLVGKNTDERMPWSVAKQAIDYILDHEDEMREQG